MKTSWLKLFSLAVIVMSCSKKNDAVTEFKTQYFAGQVVDFSTNMPVADSKVYLDRVIGYHPNPSSFTLSDRINDTANTKADGSYLFTFSNSYAQNFYSLYVQKQGYIFIGTGPNGKYDSIYKNRDTITDELYVDRATQLRIHIKDIPPFLSQGEYFDIYREYKDPVSGATRYADLKTFEGGAVDTVLIDAFSYKWSPAVKIAWQVRTNAGSPANAVIMPNNITEFGITDIQVNY